MKLVLVIILLAILGLGSLSTTSCSVTRQSERYRCEVDSDCEMGRSCDHGYCVQVPCPSQCSSCDLSSMSCKIDCTSNKPCGDVQCPAGFDCTIRCNDSGACGDIDCAQGDGCEVHCARAASCGAINCGGNECDIDCSGMSACPSIDCAASCKCDVSCNDPTTECPMISCPQRGGSYCSDGKLPNEPCDSSASPPCDRCM